MRRQLAPPPKANRRPPSGTYPRRRTVTHNARLHAALVLEIRAAHARGETTKQISERHALKYAIVRDVIVRRTWKHVEPADQVQHVPLPNSSRKTPRPDAAGERASIDTTREATWGDLRHHFLKCGAR